MRMSQAEIRDIEEFADTDSVALLVALGKAVLAGMQQVEAMEKFSGTKTLSYSTHFPTPDGREWNVTVEAFISSDDTGDKL